MGDQDLQPMIQSLAHRGPDDRGYEILTDGKSSVLLGHTRLAIIDVSTAGHQPMCNEDKTVWITYNGELYNFPELRNDLMHRGHQFVSQSDTEVIVHAYEEWGLECVRKFNGMFAFGIWDTNKRRLFLAVDCFGMKPLYYHVDGHTLVFSSEVRAILESGLVTKEIDSSAVTSFLAYGAVQAPLTIIRGVRSLLPAQYFVFDAETAKSETRTYWTPPLHSDCNAFCDREIMSRTRDELLSATRRHLVSDVPVGLFLSGGIDSSSLAILANGQLQGNLQSFSIIFGEKDLSEEKYCRIIAQRYCPEHKEIRLTPQDLLGDLNTALCAMDQPTIDGINVYTISKAVKNAGLKVVLSGLGADELFGGYSSFRTIPKLVHLSRILTLLPKSLRYTIGNMLERSAPYDVRAMKISQILRSSRETSTLYRPLRQLFGPQARARLTGTPDGDNLVDGLASEVAADLAGLVSEIDTIRAVSLLEMRLYMANTLLRDADCMGMAHGLEIRMPFLDWQLVDFVFALPSKYRSSCGVPKSLLIGAMGEDLPQEIWQRPKMGFTFPWDEWLRTDLCSQVDAVLRDDDLARNVGLHPEQCLSVWKDFLHRRRVGWARVWALFVLLTWFRKNLM